MLPSCFVVKGKKTERKNTTKNNQSLKKGGKKKQVLIETWKTAAMDVWCCEGILV